MKPSAELRERPRAERVHSFTSLAQSYSVLSEHLPSNPLTTTTLEKLDCRPTDQIPPQLPQPPALATQQPLLSPAHGILLVISGHEYAD